MLLGQESAIFCLKSGLYSISNVGTIDYAVGKITLHSFLPTALPTDEDEIHMIVTPSSNDVIPLRNQIIIIQEEDISVSTIDETTT